jgi:hypothetical protein
MNCPECEAELPENATGCGECGATLVNAPRSPADRLTEDAAHAVHDVVRAMQRVRKLGGEVAGASRSVARRAHAAKSAPMKVWTATKGVIGRESTRGRAAARRVRSRATSVGHRVARVGRHVEARARTAGRRVETQARNVAHRVTKKGSNAPK